MLSKTLISAAIAASLATLPATRAAADGKDFIAGAIIGGIGGAIIQNEVRKNKERNAARQRAVTPRTHVAKPRASYRAPAKKTYRPKIPATQEGREIQSSLNFFGFDAGTIDGRVGSKTRSAIADYQRYMGYDGTGTLTAFQQHLLTTSYLRAEAGGNRTYQDIASHPDGTRGLLKLYREDLAAGTPSPRAPAPAPSNAYVDL